MRVAIDKAYSNVKNSIFEQLLVLNAISSLYTQSPCFMMEVKCSGLGSNNNSRYLYGDWNDSIWGRGFAW